jgi:hypothetical protein
MKAQNVKRDFIFKLLSKREKKTLLHGNYTSIFETKPPNFTGNHGYS